MTADEAYLGSLMFVNEVLADCINLFNSTFASYEDKTVARDCPSGRGFAMAAFLEEP